MIESQRAALQLKQAEVKNNIAATSGNNADVMLRIEGQQYKIGVVYRINSTQIACAAQFSQEVESVDKDGTKKKEVKVTHYVVQPTNKGNIALARLFSRHTDPTTDYSGALEDDFAQSSSALDFAATLATLASEKPVVMTITGIRKTKTGYKNENGVETENTQLQCSFEYEKEVVVPKPETTQPEAAQSETEQPKTAKS